MKLTVSFDPEDGTGALTKTRILHNYTGLAMTPDGLWYALVQIMKEIIHTWRWSRAGKPPWNDREKRLAWKTEAREWTAPIDEMISAVCAAQSTSKKATSDSATTEGGPERTV